MDTTRISPTGEILGVDTPTPARKPKADCFYVYPTVSDDQSPNSDLQIDPEERSIALYQAARYALHCRVFAPMYRQLTLSAILHRQPDHRGADRPRVRRRGQRVEELPEPLQQGPRGDPDRPLAGHVRPAPADRRAGRPRKGVRKRLISALLLGGNVAVPEGGDVGGDFKHIPACRKPKQTRMRRRVLDLQHAGPGRRAIRPARQRDQPRPARRRRRAVQQPGGARWRLRAAAHRVPEPAVRARHDDRARHRGRRHPAPRGGDHAVDSGRRVHRRVLLGR